MVYDKPPYNDFILNKIIEILIKHLYLYNLYYQVIKYVRNIKMYRMHSVVYILYVCKL